MRGGFGSRPLRNGAHNHGLGHFASIASNLLGYEGWPHVIRLAMPLPDFLVVGAPKAGTTALHATLAGHPQLLLSEAKEPKFFLRGGPYADAVSGPGDAHSRREWIDDQTEYERLFEGPADRLRGESTPFYLYDRSAHQRIRSLIPAVKLIAVVRDPMPRTLSSHADSILSG